MTRNGNQVVAKLTAIRSRFTPDRIDAQVGDELTVHVTNIEQTRDMIHGFGVIEQNINMVMDPGRNKNVPHQADEGRACSRFTARTFARRCTRRCRVIWW